MPLPVPIASFETTITNKISKDVTTIPIDSVTDDDGNSMDTKVLGLVIDKGGDDEEFILGTVDAGNMQLTSVTRGVSVTDGITSVTALKKQHGKKAPIEITDHPYLVKVVRVLNGTDPAGGVMQHPSARTISNARDLVDKEYADALSVNSNPFAMVSDNGGITINIAAARILTPDGTVDYAGSSNQSLTDDAVNYIELDQNASPQMNTTGWTDGFIPLAKVTTASGDITIIEDARGFYTIPFVENSVSDDYTYGATIAVGDVVYLDTSDAKVKLADGSAEATADGKLGIALDAGVDTDTGKRVQWGGVVNGLSGLTAGWQFVSDTAGALSNTAGTYRRVAGYAPDATSMILMDAISADELTGGNSSLTVALLNEVADVFAATDITGAELETLTGGPNSDAKDEHTHSDLLHGFHFNIIYDNGGTGSNHASSGYSDGTIKGFGIGFYTTSTGAKREEFIYDVLEGVGATIWPRYRSGSTTSPSTSIGTLCPIEGVRWWTPNGSSTPYKDTSVVTVSGTGFSAGAVFGHDPTNSYLLALDSTTRIRRYSGIAGTTITNINSDITLDTAVTQLGFIYDDTNQEYICLDTTNNLLRRFDSTGTTTDTVAYSIPDDSTVRGICFVKDRVNLILVRRRDPGGSTDAHTLEVTIVPTNMVRN